MACIPFSSAATNSGAQHQHAALKGREDAEKVITCSLPSSELSGIMLLVIAVDSKCDLMVKARGAVPDN